nr:MAG TPA: hypothetical protein [Caudoviricetes sp.]
MGQKISAKQLKHTEGDDSSCANTLLFTCLLYTYSRFHFLHL